MTENSPDIFEVLSRNANKLALLEGFAHTYEPDLVSVVIANYNKLDYIEDCLDSLVEQTYTPLEIVLVDDYSEDKSFDRACDFMAGPGAIGKRAKGILRWTPIRLPRRVGTAWAQNIGYYLSKGEYIANQDSDDISCNTRLKKQVDFLVNNPSIAAVGTDYLQFAGTPGPRYPNEQPVPWLSFDAEHITSEYRANRHRVCWGTVMMRRCVIERLGGNNKKCIGAEDFEILHRLTTVENLKVSAIPEKLYYYRKCATQRSALFHGR